MITDLNSMMMCKNAPSGGGGFDADAQAFFDATGITDTTQKNAVNQLVVDLKSYSLWTKMQAIYPMVGGTETTHKFNLKDPRDLDAAFRLTYSAFGLSHDANGITPDGSNGIANTYFNPVSQGSSKTNLHLSFYCNQTIVFSGGTKCAIGYVPASNQIGFGTFTSGTRLGGFIAGGTIAGSGTTPSSGFYTIATNGSTDTTTLYANGSVVSATGNASGSFSNDVVAIFASHVATPQFLWNKRACFASIGLGLSSTDATNFYTAVQAFNTTLGRQV
jgi:hypothetical protein